MKNKIPLIMLLTMIISACGGRNYPEVTSPSWPPTASPVAEVPAWHTYENSKYGYTLKYPAAYQVETVNDEQVEIGDQIVIHVLRVDPTIPRGDGPFIESISDLQVSGYPAQLLTGYIGAVGGYMPQQYQKILVEREGLYFTVTLYALGLHETVGDISQIAPLNSADVEIFDQLVASMYIP